MACTPFIYHPREAWSRTSVLAEPFAKASGFCLLEPCLALSPPPLSANFKGARVAGGTVEVTKAAAGVRVILCRPAEGWQS